jgi:hypothetical protein
MVQRSDDKGDKRSSGKSSETEARDAESTAAKALRERIRQAGAAATARVSDQAPPQNGLIVPNSSAPPTAEHSGVRTRPPEPRSTSITPPLFGPPRLTPGAMSVPWPAVPRRREAQQTRSGLGVPPPPVAPPAQDPSQQPIGERPTLEVPVGQLNKLAGRARPAGLGWSLPPAQDQDEKSQSSAPPAPLESGPAPRAGAGGIAPPPMDTWSLSTARTQPMPRVRNESGQPPEALEPHLDAESEERRRAELATTRKTHGLLRAPEASSMTPSSPGRYSVRDVSTEYVDTGAPETPQSALTEARQDRQDHQNRTTISDEPITEEVPAIDAAFEGGVQAGQPGEAESDATRPRRSTPKQRVGHRRSSRPEMGHARERGTKRTDPGIRARTLRGGGGGSALAAKTAPQMPAAKAAPLSASNPTPPMGSPQPSAARAPALGGAIAHRSTLPLAAAPAPARPPPLPAANSGSIVVDPSLSQPNLPAASHLPVRAPGRQVGSGYVPLPRDREAYEAFLRSAAGEHGGPPRARPSWAQQETALIPREALEPTYEPDVERTIWPTARTRAVVGLVLIALSAGVGWWILEGQTAPPKLALPLPATPSSVPQQTSEARPITLIATEPSGAELLLDNAVIGNTPLEVARPTQGDAMYVIRLRGFDPQMVRITSTTRDAIHITLVPAAEPAPTPAPAPASKR